MRAFRLHGLLVYHGANHMTLTLIKERQPLPVANHLTVTLAARAEGQ